eukprot:13444048-Alexandrium_andersonii.AAC.1
MVYQAASSTPPDRAMGADEISYEVWQRVPDVVFHELAYFVTSRLYGEPVSYTHLRAHETSAHL